MKKAKPTNMTMSYEFITPEKASALLETNVNNRKLSKQTVLAYADDILNDNWDETVGAAISIDENGVLRDGQHRLSAIVYACKGVHMWVCRNVSSDGIYDNNRRRSNVDQISIMRADLDSVYKTTRYISIARSIIGYNKNRSIQAAVTPKEIIDFTEKHKEVLDGFFLNISQSTVAKISLSVVHFSLLSAYVAGVDMEVIEDFYDILCTGMSTRPEEFPIIAYRNYLKDSNSPHITFQEVARCQYALKKYMTGSCIKRTFSPKELIWNYPFEEDKKSGEEEA